jgi:hypothetical protein
VKNNTIGILLALFVTGLAVGQDVLPHRSGGISGFVRYPDGTPSAGATVSAVTQCKEMGYGFGHGVQTSPDGSFYIPPFSGVSCNRVLLSAEKVEDLWLKTGHEAFYGGDNGTTPVVEASQSGFPTATEITLGSRGALVSFRVRDTATDRFIWSRLYLERTPVPGKTFGSMLIETGRDGSPDHLLLPAGQYEISVEFYDCKAADYFTASPPREAFTVESGQRITEDITVDVRLIKPMKTHSNPRGKPCKP